MKKLLFAALLLAGACDRTHLGTGYGQAYRRAFKDQVLDPKAGENAKPPDGLDPEEAAAVVRNYRKDLDRTKDDRNEKVPVIVVPETKAGAPASK
jgi:hypothetical protein